MRQVQKTIPRVYCCIVIHSVAESRRSQQQSEEDGAQTRSQRHSLTAQHLSPRGSPASACRPTSLPAEPSLKKRSPSTTRLRSKAKPRLNDRREGATFQSFCCFLLVFRLCFYSLAERLMASLFLQTGGTSIAVFAYKRSLCLDWTPCYRRALCRG